MCALSLRKPCGIGKARDESCIVCGMHAFKVGRKLPLFWLLIGFVTLAQADDSSILADEDVNSIVQGGSSGVFYAWSPHMPLSVDGLQEIIEAGERLDLLVVPVLSSHSNVAYAREQIAGTGLPDSVLRLGRSTALVSLDLFVHAPAIVIFDNGRFVSPVLPGFRYAADYEALIGGYLKQASQ